jgi:hypothetical protein
VKRVWRPAVLVAVVVVVALPALRQPPRDGFPLSTYPMFAAERDREVVVATAVGIGPETGEVERLDPGVIADTDEVMLAAETVRLAVQGGGGARLCNEIADRLAGDADIDEVELRLETYDAVDYFDGDKDPLDVTVEASCAVPAS